MQCNLPSICVWIDFEYHWSMWSRSTSWTSLSLNYHNMWWMFVLCNPWLWEICNFYENVKLWITLSFLFLHGTEVYACVRWKLFMVGDDSSQLFIANTKQACTTFCDPCEYCVSFLLFCMYFIIYITIDVWGMNVDHKRNKCRFEGFKNAPWIFCLSFQFVQRLAFCNLPPFLLFSFNCL